MLINESIDEFEDADVRETMKSESNSVPESKIGVIYGSVNQTKEQRQKDVRDPYADIKNSH